MKSSRALLAMGILVGLNIDGAAGTVRAERLAQNLPPGEAADPTPPRPRASPAEKSNPPTSASSPAQPGSTPTTQTGVGTTVDKPAGNADKK
jgi:hypothetical protein